MMPVIYLVDNGMADDLLKTPEGHWKPEVSMALTKL